MTHHPSPITWSKPHDAVRTWRKGDKWAETEAEHFMACPNCGAPIDMRDLGQAQGLGDRSRLNVKSQQFRASGYRGSATDDGRWYKHAVNSKRDRRPQACDWSTSKPG